MRRILPAALLVLVLVPTPASAAVATSCSFDAGTATVTATIGSDASVTLERSGDEIWFDGSHCGTADVHNTDTIDITAPDAGPNVSLTISESGGAFVPGKTAEADGSDEIEIGAAMYDQPVTIEGRPVDDEISLGPNGADLLQEDGDTDREVTFSPNEQGTLNLLGGGGADELRIDAYDGTVEGGSGQDTLVAGISQPATYDGGPGHDVMTYPGLDQLIVRGTAADAATVERLAGTDTLVDLETIEGGHAADAFVASDAGNHFVGNGGNDLLIGGDGDDRFFGRSGNDVLAVFDGDDFAHGGHGYDTFAVTDAASHVDFDMTNGLAIGFGTDRFRDIERIQGTPTGDHFAGDPRARGILLVDGYGGRDLLDFRAAGRPETVFTAPEAPVAVPSWVTFVAQDIRKVTGSPFADLFVVGSVGGKELRARFDGMGGRDRLVGGSHQDVLRGNGGDDRLNGEAGIDRCDGGLGDDVLVNCEG